MKGALFPLKQVQKGFFPHASQTRSTSGRLQGLPKHPKKTYGRSSKKPTVGRIDDPQ